MYSCSFTTLLLFISTVVFFSLLTFFLKRAKASKTRGGRCKSQLHPTVVLKITCTLDFFFTPSTHTKAFSLTCSYQLLTISHMQMGLERVEVLVWGIFLNEVRVQTPKSLAFLVSFCFWKQSPVTKQLPITECEHKKTNCQTDSVYCRGKDYMIPASPTSFTVYLIN